MAGVKLNISAKEKGAGWQPVVASDGQCYWYKFTGGNQFDNGDQVFGVGAQQQFMVSLKSKAAKKFRLCCFVDVVDPDDQLTGSVSSDGKTGTVTDACSKECHDIIYGFRVHPIADPGSVFLCHPRINNQLGLE